MTMRCATYARYSSDRQSPSSITDQLRKCREFADSQGWEVLDDHSYVDEALSGFGSDRPGFMKLVEAAGETPLPFDVLLVDDTSRISRNLGSTINVLDRLKFRGVRVVAVSQGIDTHSEQAEVLTAVHGLVDSLYIKELGKKTHRGLEGNALKGLHTGGRCFGYDIVHGVEGVQKRINEDEAAVVRRIFEMAADGSSLKTIAKTLNKDHVPSPRPRSRKKYATWCPSAVREMLRRDLYAGKIIWNKSRFVKQPGTNKRLRRPRPANEWKIVDQPELRIVDETLWERVQNRLLWVAENHTYANRPGLCHRALTSTYLLSGFMKCGSCGADLTIVAGRGKHRHPKYGCPQNHNRGACPNTLVERADFLEERLFHQLQSAVLRPEAIDYAVDEFERQLAVALSGLNNRIGAMRQRSDVLEGELQNLITTVASCGPSPSLVEAINNREQELKDIRRQLLSTETDSVSGQVARIRGFVQERLGNIRQMLNADVQRAKAELRKHLTSVRMIPQTDGTKRHYMAEGEWYLLGGYGEDAGNSATDRIRMVAGEGFEPSTFGL